VAHRVVAPHQVAHPAAVAARLRAAHPAVEVVPLVDRPVAAAPLVAHPAVVEVAPLAAE
jgi:hypothetical protein